MQAPLGTVLRQFVKTLKEASNLLSQSEPIDASRQIFPNQQYEQMQMVYMVCQFYFYESVFSSESAPQKYSLQIQ